MTSFDQPMSNKPPYFWDEAAGLKEDKPFYVKLITTERQQREMPSKNPALFGFTVGYTLPFDWTSHAVRWHVIPADCELRRNELVFVPMPKHSPLTKVRTEPVHPVPEEPKARKKKAPPPLPEIKEPPRDPALPTYRVAYLPLPLHNKTRPAITIGVTYRTQHGNHRIAWDVQPSSEALAEGHLFLDPYETDDPLPEEASWWRRVMQRG